MRRVSLCVVAALALVVAFVVPEGSATAKKGRSRRTCAIAPFSYTVTTDDPNPIEDTGAVLTYSASGATTLSCREGHPWNGAEVNVDVLEAKVIDDGGRLTGRATYVFDTELLSLSFMAKIRGTSSPDGNGGSTLDFNVSGRSSDGAKLRLHEVGTLAPFDQGGALVSLATIRVNPRDGTFTGT